MDIENIVEFSLRRIQSGVKLIVKAPQVSPKYMVLIIQALL